MYEITNILDNIASFAYSLAGKPYVLNRVPYEVIPIEDDGTHLVYNPLNQHFSSQEDLEARLKHIQEHDSSYVLRGETKGYTTYALIAPIDTKKVAKIIPEGRFKQYFA